MAISPVWPIGANVTGLESDRKAIVERFVASVNAIIPNLNGAIERYNQETDPKEKLEKLKKLHRDIEIMQAEFSDKAVSRSMDYVFHIQGVLFHEIQQEFKALGLPSMQADALRESRVAVSHPESPAEIIANMAPNKANQLAKILASGDLSKVAHLYQPGEAGKDIFDDFLGAHFITYLGGGNSRNFTLTRKGTTPKEKCVLKLENRMGMPIEMEAHLRAGGLQGVLTSISADRQVTYGSFGSNLVTRRLVVTEYCDGTDLVKHSKKYLDDEARLDAAVDLYTQMADVLKKIQADGCAFPDMKNTNWLVDDGILRIADTKAFVFTDAHGNVDMLDAYNQYGGIIQTTHMNPPEFKNIYTPFSADKMHSYMLGKNLYQNLTQCPDIYFFVNPMDRNSELKDVAALDFNAPIFRMGRGKLSWMYFLKSLIKEMMQTNPAARPSLEVACARLKNIGAPPVRQTSALFNEVEGLKQEMKKIKALGMDEQDTQMNQFIEAMERRMRQADTQEDIELIKREMSSVLSQLEANQEMMDTIKQVVAIQSGPDALAHQTAILSAVGNVPLEERVEIGKAQTDETREAKQLIRDGRKRVIDPLKQALEKIKALGMGEYDTQMNQFIEAMERRMRQADSQEAIQGIRDDMLSTFNHLKDHKALIEGIKEVVEKQSGPDAEAHQTAILSAVGNVPLEERVEIGKAQTDETREAKRLIQAGEARIFNAFKTKAQELVAPDDTIEPPKKEDKSGNPSQ